MKTTDENQALNIVRYVIAGIGALSIMIAIAVLVN